MSPTVPSPARLPRPCLLGCLQSRWCCVASLPSPAGQHQELGYLLHPHRPAASRSSALLPGRIEGAGGRLAKTQTDLILLCSPWPQAGRLLLPVPGGRSGSGCYHHCFLFLFLFNRLLLETRHDPPAPAELAKGVSSEGTCSSSSSCQQGPPWASPCLVVPRRAVPGCPRAPIPQHPLHTPPPSSLAFLRVASPRVTGSPYPQLLHPRPQNPSVGTPSCSPCQPGERSHPQHFGERQGRGSGLSGAGGCQGTRRWRISWPCTDTALLFLSTSAPCSWAEDTSDPASAINKTTFFYPTK